MTNTDIYLPSQRQIDNFKPTFLYIKRHSITGQLYFGKTTNKDPLRYNGSGKAWKLHINKHGKDLVETLWYCLFTDINLLSEFALNFSKQENIKQSDKWKNLRLENGLDGGDPGIAAVQNIKKALTGTKRKQSSIDKQKQTLKDFPVVITEERRAKLSAAAAGQIWTKERKAKVSEIHKTNERCVTLRKKNFDRTGKIPWNKGLKTGPKYKNQYPLDSLATM